MSKRLLAGTWWVLVTPVLAQGQEPAAQAAVAVASTHEAEPPPSTPPSTPPPQPSAPEPPPAVEAEPLRFALPNGLRVVLQPDHTRPRVAITVAYGVGSRDDPAGYQGLAHLTEHAMFEGTAAPGYADFHAWLAAAGVTVSNAITSDDFTTYFEELPSAQLGLGLWLEAMRMGHLLSWLDAPMVERSRAAVLHEVEDNRGGCFGECLRAFQVAALYPEGHPYRLPLELGEDVEVIKLPHVQWFFQEWYGPDNATLAVVGDFEPEAVRARITELFSPLAKRVAPARRVTPKPLTLEGESRLTIKRWSKTPFCSHVWPVAEAASVEEDRALDVLAAHLTRELSRRSLEHEHLQSAHAMYAERELGGEFQLQWYLAEDGDVAVVEREVKAMLEELETRLLTARELGRARDSYKDSMLFRRENLVSRSIQLAQGERPGSYVSFTDMAAQYGAVTADQVREAARRWLPTERLVTLCTEYADNAPRLGKVKRRRFVPARKAP
jgi:zinc protease